MTTKDSAHQTGRSPEEFYFNNLPNSVHQNGTTPVELQSLAAGSQDERDAAEAYLHHDAQKEKTKSPRVSGPQVEAISAQLLPEFLESMRVATQKDAEKLIDSLIGAWQNHAGLRDADSASIEEFAQEIVAASGARIGDLYHSNPELMTDLIKSGLRVIDTQVAQPAEVQPSVTLTHPTSQPIQSTEQIQQRVKDLLEDTTEPVGVVFPLVRYDEAFAEAQQKEPRQEPIHNVEARDQQELVFIFNADQVAKILLTQFMDEDQPQVREKLARAALVRYALLIQAWLDGATRQDYENRLASVAHLSKKVESFLNRLVNFLNREIDGDLPTRITVDQLNIWRWAIDQQLINLGTSRAETGDLEVTLPQELGALIVNDSELTRQVDSLGPTDEDDKEGVRRAIIVRMAKLIQAWLTNNNFKPGDENLVTVVNPDALSYLLVAISRLNAARNINLSQEITIDQVNSWMVLNGRRTEQPPVPVAVTDAEIRAKTDVLYFSVITKLATNDSEQQYVRNLLDSLQIEKEVANILRVDNAQESIRRNGKDLVLMLALICQALQRRRVTGVDVDLYQINVIQTEAYEQLKAVLSDFNGRTRQQERFSILSLDQINHMLEARPMEATDELFSQEVKDRDNKALGELLHDNPSILVAMELSEASALTRTDGFQERCGSFSITRSFTRDELTFYCQVFAAYKTFNRLKGYDRVSNQLKNMLQRRQFLFDAVSTAYLERNKTAPQQAAAAESLKFSYFGKLRQDIKDVFAGRKPWRQFVKERQRLIGTSVGAVALVLASIFGNGGDSKGTITMLPTASATMPSGEDSHVPNSPLATPEKTPAIAAASTLTATQQALVDQIVTTATVTPVGPSRVEATSAVTSTNAAPTEASAMVSTNPAADEGIRMGLPLDGAPETDWEHPIATATIPKLGEQAQAGAASSEAEGSGTDAAKPANQPEQAAASLVAAEIQRALTSKYGDTISNVQLLPLPNGAMSVSFVYEVNGTENQVTFTLSKETLAKLVEAFKPQEVVKSSASVENSAIGSVEVLDKTTLEDIFANSSSPSVAAREMVAKLLAAGLVDQSNTNGVTDFLKDAIKILTGFETNDLATQEGWQGRVPTNYPYEQAARAANEILSTWRAKHPKSDDPVTPQALEELGLTSEFAGMVVTLVQGTEPGGAFSESYSSGYLISVTNEYFIGTPAIAQIPQVTAGNSVTETVSIPSSIPAWTVNGSPESDIANWQPPVTKPLADQNPVPSAKGLPGVQESSVTVKPQPQTVGGEQPEKIEITSGVPMTETSSANGAKDEGDDDFLSEIGLTVEAIARVKGALQNLIENSGSKYPARMKVFADKFTDEYSFVSSPSMIALLEENPKLFGQLLDAAIEKTTGVSPVRSLFQRMSDPTMVDKMMVFDVIDFAFITKFIAEHPDKFADGNPDAWYGLLGRYYATLGQVQALQQFKFVGNNPTEVLSLLRTLFAGQDGIQTPKWLAENPSGLHPVLGNQEVIQAIVAAPDGTQIQISWGWDEPDEKKQAITITYPDGQPKTYYSPAVSKVGENEPSVSAASPNTRSITIESGINPSTTVTSTGTTTTLSAGDNAPTSEVSTTVNAPGTVIIDLPASQGRGMDNTSQPNMVSGTTGGNGGIPLDLQQYADLGRAVGEMLQGAGVDTQSVQQAIDSSKP